MARSGSSLGLLDNSAGVVFTGEGSRDCDRPVVIEERDHERTILERKSTLVLPVGTGPGSNTSTLRRNSSNPSRASILWKKSFRHKPNRRSVIQFKQTFKSFKADPTSPGPCAVFLTGVSALLVIITLPWSLAFCIKVVQEYERAVIFRLGRLRPGGAKGPGIFFVIPCVDQFRCVDLRTVSFDVPPQEILSCDSVTVSVDAVVYFNVIDAELALCSVDDFSHSTRLLAATTLRNVLGTKNLSQILAEREAISQLMQSVLDEATDPWGVKVERVEVKDVRLPVHLQRAMATEAEAAREARAKVIAAEGEQKASRALKEAAEVIHESPHALQLRYLQTLNSISAEHNSTIIFPMPISLPSLA